MPRATILFFTLVNILNYLDRYLVAAVLPLLMVDLHLNNEEAGRLTSAFVFGYFAFSPIFGSLGDRYSRPKLMAIGIGLWSVATIATGFTSTILSFIAVRIFVGIGEASFTSIAPGYLKDRIQDPVKVNQALALFFSAIPVGSALGYVVGGYVGHHYGWQNAFLLGGVPGLILALFFLRFPDTRVRSTEETPGNFWQNLRQIARVPILWFAIGGYVLNNFALTGIGAFVAKHGVNLGFALDDINMKFGLILVCTGFIGTMVGGRISSKIAARSQDASLSMLKFVGISALLAVPCLAYAFVTDNHWMFLTMCFFGELFVFAGVAPINSIIVLCCPPHLVALTQGVTIFFLNLFGSLAAPWVIGWVADASSLRLALQLTTATMAGSAVVWLWGSRGRFAKAC